MEVFGLLILGLGLFFLGMRLVGENLRRVSGPSFRALMARSSGAPVEAGLLGLVFGALMQSATAVTFILVSMVSSGLIAPGAAFPVITWTNVGLTALAFIVTLNFQPVVAYLVGLSAVLASLVRRPTYQALAGVLLGVGLILYGLETMGSSAQPLVQTQWFAALLHHTTTSPMVAFIVGIVVAAVLQSNTASTLLIITLARAGAFHLDSALMLIYGTNLGAIALRFLLAAELRGTSLQLVRFEDLFCLTSGGIMVALFYAETFLGLPLVRAAITRVSSNLGTQLAMAFLLSNFLPAVVVSIFQGRCQTVLGWLWPATAEEEAAKPKFIYPGALADPNTALDLLQREIARLQQGVRGLIAEQGNARALAANVEALGRLTERIDTFAVQLASRPCPPATAERLNLLREELSMVTYVKESTHHLCQSLATMQEKPTVQAVAERLRSTAARLLDRAVTATTATVTPNIEALRQDAAYRGELIAEVQQFCWQRVAELESPSRVAVLQTLNDLQMIASTLHHLAKVLSDLAPDPASGSSAVDTR